ncbi:MAG: nuclear transport factor 2 family protein [Flavobacteriales bacterium]
MKLVLYTLMLSLLSLSLTAQHIEKDSEVIEANALKVVRAQLEAYNAKDLDTFLDAFSDSVKVYTFPDILRSEGKQALTKSFTDFFSKAGDLHSEILSRIVTGNVVIDEELVTGFSKDNQGEFYVTAIYTVTDGTISEMRFIYR